jgi:hypothetical protein
LNPGCRLPAQLPDFIRELFRLLVQIGAFLFQQLGSLRCQFIQHARPLLDNSAKLVFGALLQLLQRFDDGDDFQLQRLMQPPQLRQFHLVAEIQARPALPQDEARRVFRDFAQRLDVARLFRAIDGSGQLFVSRQLVRLVRELAEVKVNGQSCGIVWCPPYRMDITSAMKSGENKLEIEVVNFWPNRIIGDASLPPERRLTQTNIRKLTAKTPLEPAGLFGPVQLLEGKK